MAHFQFPEWTQKFKPLTFLLLGGAPVYLVALVFYGKSADAVRTGYEPTQPVPYSHALHVGELGLDCRYCHNTVEKSYHSAVPPSSTCMNCHKSVQADSAKLLPVREAANNGEPVKWVRVNDLPDYVFFNHAAHVNRGVGCESCHGRVDLMEEVSQAKPLTMAWCLECHQTVADHSKKLKRRDRGEKVGDLPDVSAFIRPIADITKMGYSAPNQAQQASDTIHSLAIQPRTDCSTCHR